MPKKSQKIETEQRLKDVKEEWDPVKELKKLNLEDF